MQANKVNLFSYKVPRKLVVSCNSAYGRYEASLEEKAKEAEKTVEKERRELFQEELHCLIDKEKTLATLPNSLDDDFQALVYKKEGRATTARPVTKFRGYRRMKSHTPPTN